MKAGVRAFDLFLFFDLPWMPSRLIPEAATARQFIESLAQSCTALLEGLLREVTGPMLLGEKLYGTITWADVLTAILFFLLVLVASAVARALFRRKIKRGEVESGVTGWRVLILDAA